MSEDVGVRPVVDHARGVMAERFGVAIVTADGILNNVARAQGRDVTELAVAVVASCTSDANPLPRSLYAEGAA
ncbi:MAG: hypothetical protein ACJ74C_12380 [Gaiellaceae bacterium]